MKKFIQYNNVGVFFLFFIIQLFLSFQFLNGQQKIQIVNDNKLGVADNKVWVLVVGNPATITGMTGGVRDTSQLLATGSVSVGSTSFTTFSATYTPIKSPQIVPFPIQFTTGSNSGDKIYKVKAYNTTTGLFTLDSALPNLPMSGDDFTVGVYSQKLSTMNKISAFKSPLSGENVNVYEFIANKISSGVIFISQDSKDSIGNVVSGQLPYFNASPAFQKDDIIPFQTVELSTGGQTSVDTTVIDYFSMPLQIEALDSAGTSIPDTLRTFYSSKASVKKQIEALGAKPINTNNDKDFVRFLGPGQAIHNNGDGSSAPFASFSLYLDSLIKSGKGFSISKTKQGFINPNPAVVYGLDVSQYFADYSYNGVVSKVGDNYSIVLTPTAKGNKITAQAPTTVVTTIERDIAHTTVTINLPKDSLNETIYGATLTIGDSGSFSLTPAPTLADYSITTSGTVTSGHSLTTFQSAPFATKNYLAPFKVRFTTGKNTGKDYSVSVFAANGTFIVTEQFKEIPASGDAFDLILDEKSVLTQFYTNSVYSYAVADILSALNFGFLDSTASGDKGSEWYAQFPQRFPFADARIWDGHNNDHHYNEWASIFYNSSDAYSFAFSDRVSPSPLIGIDPRDQVLRITYLPENQLDAPITELASRTDNELNISWVASTDVLITYDITIDPLDADAVIGAVENNSSVKISGLRTGAPYRVNVKAIKASSNQESLVLPLFTSTSGNFTPQTYSSDASNIPFQISLTWALAYSAPADIEYYFNGGVDPFDPAEVNTVHAYGKNGTNAYAVVFKDKNTKEILFKTDLLIDFIAEGDSPTEMKISGTPRLLYNSTLKPVTIAPVATDFPITYNAPANPTSPLVVALDFSPLARKMIKSTSGSTATMTLIASPEDALDTINIPLGPNVKAKDVAIQIIVTAKTGYTFKNWTISGLGYIANPILASTTVTLTGDATVTVNFITTETATLTMGVSPVNSGITEPLIGATPEAMGAHVGITAIKNNGYVFKNWTISGQGEITDLTNPESQVKLSGAATVTANFKVAPVDVNLSIVAPVDSSAGEIVIPTVGVHATPKGVPVTITANVYSGYTFKGWVVTGSANIADKDILSTTVTPYGDATITAEFAKKEILSKLEISTSLEGAGHTNPGVGNYSNYYVGDNVVIEAIVNDDYIFTGWSGSGISFILGAKQPKNKIKITSATASLVANFTRKAEPKGSLTIIANPDGKGTTNKGIGEHSGYYINQSFTLTSEAVDGYQFASWSGVGVSIINPKNPMTAVVIESFPASVTVNFAQEITLTNLTISLSPALSGSSNPGVGVHTNYHVDGVIPIEANPSSDYHFSNWSSTGLSIGDSTDASTTATVTGTTSTLIAHFDKNLLSVDIALASIPQKGGSSPATISRNGNNSGVLLVTLSSSNINEATVPDSVTILDGESSAKFTVTAVDDGTANGPQVIKVTAKATAYDDGTDTVTVDSATSYLLTVNQGSGSGNHLSGMVVPIVADAPKDGQLFNKWIGDIANVADANLPDTTFTMPPKATSIIATYVVDPLSAHKLTIGSKISVKTSELSGMDNEFVTPPIVYGKYSNPLNQKSSSSNTRSISKISLSAPDNCYNSLWSRTITLYDKKERSAANKAGTSTADWINSLPNNKIADLESTLWAKAITLSKSKINVHFRGGLIVSPTISDVVCWDGTALNNVYSNSIVIIKGSYFGNKPPIVGLEYTNAGTGAKKQQRLKVLKPYKFSDANGRANRSCMDLSSDSGESEIRVAMPKVWRKDWTSGNYDLILDNKMGLATYTIVTTDTKNDPNSNPVANSYTVTLQGGDSSYLIDVTANDSDVDSNAVTIVLDDKLTNLNGKVSISSGKIKYTPPRGVLSAAYPDTFTYSLRDDHGGASGDAIVTVNMNAITVDPIEHWDGLPLGSRRVQPASVLIITGKSFGIKKPTASITVENNKVIKLKILSKAEYENYKGKANSSFTDTATGDSQIKVQLPLKAWIGYSDSTSYSITVSNKFDASGASADVITSDSNSAPVAKDDNVNILSGKKSYYIDVLANKATTSSVIYNIDGIDEDAESDEMTILLNSKLSKLGATLRIDKSTNRVVYTRAKNILFKLTDSFEYSLKDPLGAVSETATVTVNGKLNPQ